MGKNRSPAYVLGVGLTKFIKPRGKVDYTELGFEAGVKALLDAQINYDDVEQGIACYCYGDSTCGQRVFYQFGMTQIPIYNVNNNCSTGSTGLYIARNMVSHGVADCVMVVGFEKMFPGSLQRFFPDRESPTATTTDMMKATRGITNSPGAAQMFGNAGIEYMEKYGATPTDFAEIARINHLHSAQNPYSQFQTAYTLPEILASPLIHSPLTKLQCCPTSDGGASAIIVSESFLSARPHLCPLAIRIAGQHLATDAPSLFNRSAISLVGYDMSAHAAKEAMAEAKISPKDVSGKAHDMVRKADITFGGRCVVNPSGGLISKGHPLGASGIAQCAELVWQLRGWANTRLVEGAKVALQQNLGLGGAAVVTVYVRPDGKGARRVEGQDVAVGGWVGYNPATKAGGFTKEQVNRVLSQKYRSEWAEGETERKVRARF